VAFFNYILIPGMNLSHPPWVFGLLLVGRAAFQSLREGHFPRPGPFGLALLLFGITTIANGVFAYISDDVRFADYGRTEFQFLLMLGVVFAFTRARLDQYAVARLLKVWVWMAALAAAFGIYEGIARVIGLPVPELPIAARGYVSVHVKEFFGFFAISSWFGEPSWLGSFLLIPLLYVIAVIVLDPPAPFCFRKKWWAPGLAALLLLAMFLCLSQAAYASLLVIAIPVLWSVRGRLRLGRTMRAVGIPALLIVAVAVGFSSGGADIIRAQWERVASIATSWSAPERAWQGTSYSVRVTDMRGGLTLWESAPLTGVGINQVRHVPAARQLLTNAESGSVDSGLVQLLVEQGLVGLGALLLALVLLWERLNQAYARARDPGLKFLLWFLKWGLITDLVNSIFTHPWQHPQRWLVIALAASLLSGLPQDEPATGATPAVSR